MVASLHRQRFLDRGLGSFDPDELRDVARDEFLAVGVFQRGAAGGVDVLDRAGADGVGAHVLDHEPDVAGGQGG